MDQRENAITPRRRRLRFWLGRPAVAHKVMSIGTSEIEFDEVPTSKDAIAVAERYLKGGANAEGDVCAQQGPTALPLACWW